MRRDFLSEGNPAAGERPQGVFRGRGRRLEGPRAEAGAAPKQALIGEALEGCSHHRRRVDDDLLQRVHRRGARLHGGIPRDFELPHHLDGPVRAPDCATLRESVRPASWVGRPPLRSRHTARSVFKARAARPVT